MKIDQADLVRLGTIQDVARVQIVLQNAFRMHPLDQAQHPLKGRTFYLVQRPAGKRFGNQNTLPEATPAPTLTMRKMMNNRDIPVGQLASQIPLVAGLRGFQEELERAEGVPIVTVSLDVAGFSIDGRARDQFERGLFNHLKGRR